MPLVIFNYNKRSDGLIADNGEFRFEQVLPYHTQDKKWTLRAVNALYYPKEETPGDFRFIEMKIPELMNRTSMLFRNVGVGTDEPNDFFRFYTKHYELSQKDNEVPELFHEYSHFQCVSEYPNWDLGQHHLENDRLTFIIRTGFGNVLDTSKSIESLSIILSFEE